MDKKRACKHKYVLKLYVTGQTPNSVRAIENLNKILSEEFKDMHELKIIDILENPQFAMDAKILVTPTLSSAFRGSIKRVVGDLGNREKVLSVLGLF